MPITEQDLRARFGWNEPTRDHTAAIQALRDELTTAAVAIVGLTPESRYQSLALTALEEAAMWANKAVVQHD